MNSKSDMPLAEHVEEFRSRLVKVLVAHVIVTLLAFSQSGTILKELTKLNPQMELIFIQPSEIMLVYIQIAFVVAIICCLPYTIWHIWGFVSKGLYANEKLYVKIVLAMSFVFFIIGILFGYFIMAPVTLKFFTRIAIKEVNPMISVKSYINFILRILISLGIVFNIPSFVLLATNFGLITPDTLKAYNKHIIVIIFIIAAIVTPPDVVSQLMMALPMVLLLEFSIFVSKKVYRKKQLRDAKTKESLEEVEKDDK